MYTKFGCELNESFKNAKLVRTHLQNDNKLNESSSKLEWVKRGMGMEYAIIPKMGII